MEKEAEKKAVMELKQELQRVRILLAEEAPTVPVDEDDDLELRFTESAIHTLRALKALKLKQSDGGLTMLKNLGLQHPPQEFLCPISGLLITDPVVVDIGQTYDKEAIQKWMTEGNTRCPKTNEELGGTDFTPNHLLKGIILKWCKQNQVSFFQKRFEKMSVFERKGELQRVMEEDDDDMGFVHDAFETLYGLRELKLNQEPPEEFLCPISGILMTDPVVAASGQTFDYTHIENWVKQGNTRCPKTDEPLSHSLLIPNHSIGEIIAKWCKANHLRPPPRRPSQYEGIKEDVSLDSLLEKFPSLDRSYQADVVRDIRFLSTGLSSFRKILRHISPLLTPFMIRQFRSDAAMYSDAVVTILNIATVDVHKAKVVKDCPALIPFLIQALQGQNTLEIRGYAAAALCELSEIYSNNLVIGKSGAVRPLINLLELGHPVASREAASAVLRLITLIENKERVLSEGGLAAVMDKLEDHALLDKILQILVSFTNHQQAVEIMRRRGLMPRLFRIIVETRSMNDEENCVFVIFAMVGDDKTRLLDVEKVAGALKILYDLSNNGTAWARLIANGLLSKIKGKQPADVEDQLGLLR